MYRMAPGPQPLPGTQLVQRLDGVGSYYQTPTYFATPAGQSGIRGLGCSCGCGNCNEQGFGGWGDGGGLFNTGLFSAGADYTQWGYGEWAVVLGAAWMLFSTASTTKRAVAYGRGVPRRARKSLAKKAARVIGGK